MKPTQWRF